MVESQFDKIENEVKIEVQKRFAGKKKERKIKEESIHSRQARNVLEKSKTLRRNEALEQKEVKTNLSLSVSKLNESVILPDNKGRTVSFKDHLETQLENDSKEFKFEVLEKKFVKTGTPIILNKTVADR